MNVIVFFFQIGQSPINLIAHVYKRNKMPSSRKVLKVDNIASTYCLHGKNGKVFNTIYSNIIPSPKNEFVKQYEIIRYINPTFKKAKRKLKKDINVENLMKRQRLRQTMLND